MVWGAFLDNAWRRVTGLGGVVGFDLEQARSSLARAGLDEDVCRELLAACEFGALKALNTKDDDDGAERA